MVAIQRDLVDCNDLTKRISGVLVRTRTEGNNFNCYKARETSASKHMILDKKEINIKQIVFVYQIVNISFKQ